MGIDYDSKLIVGFDLDTEKLKTWMEENNVKWISEVIKIIKEKFPEIPKKECAEKSVHSSAVSIYVVNAGNCFIDDERYYISFFKKSITIGDINKITQEHLELAKKIYKFLMGVEPEPKCETVNDIKVYSVSNVW